MRLPEIKPGTIIKFAIVLICLLIGGGYFFGPRREVTYYCVGMRLESHANMNVTDRYEMSVTIETPSVGLLPAVSEEDLTGSFNESLFGSYAFTMPVEAEVTFRIINASRDFTLRLSEVQNESRSIDYLYLRNMTAMQLEIQYIMHAWLEPHHVAYQPVILPMLIWRNERE